MSVVVAFKYKNGVIMGADKRVTYGWHLKDDIVSKITMTQYTQHGMGSVGDLLHNNLLHVKDELMDYKDILDKTEVDLSYMIAHIVPNLKMYLKSCGALSEENGVACVPSAFLYCTKDKIFQIGGDFSVIEYPSWGVIGCGEELVTGLLSNFEDEQLAKLTEQKAIEVMANCIAYACKKDNAVSENFEVMLIK